jgi:hypothetical protein
MNRTKEYIDLKGQSHSLADLDAEERALVRELTDYAKGHDWNDYSNFWMPKVGEFYGKRGLARQETRRTVVYRVAQDLGSRLAVAEGLARPPDYRDDLAELIRTRFRTRRAFCEATGISEDMLSHVLAGRKHLAIDTLTEALGRIGYTLHIAPLSEAKAS